MNVLQILFRACWLATALGACATRPAAPPAAPPQIYFRDESFAAPVQRIDAADVFALSDAMKRYIHGDIAGQLRADGLPRGLINALLDRGRLKLDYDAARTLNAAEAFEARKGNCLSLVIMTAAFAKELGLQVTYQTVAVDETWSRSNDIVFLSAHVNVTLGRRAINTTPGYDPNRSLTVDFLPPEDIGGQYTRAIPEDTIVAMYMNNRSAEALVRGDIDEAYWWARGAMQRTPEFSTPYNTLGVVYLRHGDLQAAQAVLSHLLDGDPRDRQALTNLAVVLERLGRSEEAAALRARLAQIEPIPPYHFFLLGTAAMQRGDYRTAKSLFEKEIDRADYCSECHFWLGIADLRLGDVAEARKQLADAMETSTTKVDYELYAAKLQRLRTQGVQ